MANVYVSPGVYTREQDFSVFASRIGITRLGLVGKTEKGPAFEPIKIGSTDAYSLMFGGTSPDLPLSYVANSFLGQSNELTVTRILGSDGFTNSPAWLLVADYATTFMGTTTQTGMTFSIANQSVSTGWTITTSADTSMADGTITAVSAGNDVFVNFSGSAISTTTWLNTVNSTSFSGFGITVLGASSSTYISSAGTSVISLSANTIESKGSLSGSTLAVLRSKRHQTNGDFFFGSEAQIQIGNITTALGDFTLSATTGSTGSQTAVTPSNYTVSLDETKDSYIVKILGKSPKIISGLPNFYVEKIYPHFLREGVNRGQITGLYLKPVFSTEAVYTDSTGKYTNAVTPWVVGRSVGGNVKDLFRVQTIADGDASNREIKISVANLDLVNYTFDLIVRRFEDTDATASSTGLERWSNLSFDPSSTSYIGKVIGTTDESYPRKSSFITVDLAENIAIKSTPAGFRGYDLRASGISGTTSAGIFYKTDYLSGDSKFKTYLGISELGYSSLTQSNSVSVFNAVKSIEADLFAFDGSITSGVTTTKGFHLENTASASEFVSGSKGSLTDYINTTTTLVDKTLLKFTLVPYGGFDGWDKYKQYTNTFEEFTDGHASNVNAFKLGVDKMANPEEVDINLFATPGIDFDNNTTLIRYALDAVESRADSLYIMDSPRITDGTNKGTPEELVSMLEAQGIDSNYSTTYWPWIQIEDSSSNIYTYQSPTLMAVRAMAFTDNISSPWFAPAGLLRGLANSNVIRADIKLSKDQRDVLYNGRINPIATFVQQGITIWGQKTLQVRTSALDRINVRRLLLQVQRLVASSSKFLVFEENDQTLRDQFLAKVEPILLQIQNQRGLTKFKVVMDDSNNTSDTIDRNQLIGKIQLQPTKSAEIIDLTFEVLPSGAVFSDF